MKLKDREYVLLLTFVTLDKSKVLHFASPGVFCKTWDVTLPQRIVGISHSCITVPCHFEVPNEHEAGVLQCTDSGVWRKGNMTGPFINSLNSQSPLNNVVQVGGVLFVLFCFFTW